jgi:hypothetical protein
MPWEVVSGDSQVLAIHAAPLPTNEILYFGGDESHHGSYAFCLEVQEGHGNGARTPGRLRARKMRPLAGLLQQPVQLRGA